MAATTTPWVDGLTIGDMLRRTSARFPDRDAVVFTGLDAQGNPFPPGIAPADRAPCYRRSYGRFDADVDWAARALMAAGIEKGDHVACWATNWPQWMQLQYAAARVGAVMVMINPAYRSSELAYVLKQSDSKALFLVDRFRTSDYFRILEEAIPGLSEQQADQLNLEDFPRLKSIISMKDVHTPAMRSWTEFLQQAELVSPEQLAEREAALDAGDAINIQYTSGTTGFPKGATLTHRNLLLNAYYVGDCEKLTEADRVVVPVPFYHCFGCVLGVLAVGVYGSAIVIPAEYFQAEATLHAIESERGTAIYGVPTMFIAQLEHPTFAQRDLSSLRTGIMAGSPCPIEIMQRVVNEMGAQEITIAYGLTEASPVITQTRTDDPLELRVKTVGRPIPGVEVKVIDPATGESLGDGQQGELCTRGHVVMLGYYNMPEATAAAIDSEGWLHTGDLAVRLPNGYYRITGRMKDMICRGGENIYPREIEEFFYTHPAVQDVAVVGVPDARYVEEVAAWIRLREGASITPDELRAWCRDKLAHYKVPRYIRIVDEFPQTVTGKIQKYRIREMMIEELGLQAAETA